MAFYQLFDSPFASLRVKRPPKRPERNVAKRIAQHSNVCAYRVHAVVLEAFGHHAYIFLEFNRVVIEPAGRTADS